MSFPAGFDGHRGLHEDGAPLRVAILVKRFPRLSETFILHEFLELRRQGLEVDLYAIMDPGERHSQPEALALVPEVTYLQPGSLISEAGRIWRTGLRHPWGTVKATLWAISRRTRPALRNLIHAMVLVDHLDRRGPYHLHAHFLHSPAALAFIARKISGQPYSVTGHAKDIYTTLPENLVMRCRDARFVTTCTGANREYLINVSGLPASKVHLCHHGVSVDLFACGAVRPVPGRIVSVGRMVPKKGFEVLIKAAGILHRGGTDFELRLIGGGDLKTDLKALAEKEGVARQVTFLGSCSQAEVAQELQGAEIFALTPVVTADGDRDGIPNVILEAMATGVPVVASSVSGIPEVIVDGHTGRLAPEGDASAVAQALAELLADPVQRSRLGSAGCSLVHDSWRWELAVRPLVKLLEEASGVASQPSASDEPQLRILP